ncbi:MAG: DUF4943 domain-containing protein [Bacteroidales bacterium]|nr:DUF4943 domain-containing protein [Bacteroidales bacterium]
MKILFLPIIATLLNAYSCNEESMHDEVNLYIEQVRINQYHTDTLPHFSPDAISILMKHANDFSKVKRFPTNVFSSFQSDNLTLGECLLCTIENIRLNYGNYQKYSFPCRVAEIQYDITVEPGTGGISSTDESDLHRAYQLYYDWWFNNEKGFEEKRIINPLEGSGLRWL